MAVEVATARVYTGEVRKVVLETAEERVILLKAGLAGTDIEKIYIEWNHFRIVTGNVFKEPN